MKKFLLALTAVTTTLATLPTHATGSFDEHKTLYDTIMAAGVTVTINNPKYCNGRVDGSYTSRSRVLSICQDRATYMNNEVDWTANDLDTLRHEAHHMLQDCVRGSVGDSQLGLYITNNAKRTQFIEGVLGRAEMKRLMALPVYAGKPDSVKHIELEAFATAAVVSPNEIASAIQTYCM